MHSSRKRKKKKIKPVAFVLFIVLALTLLFSIKPLYNYVQKQLYPVQYQQEVTQWAAAYGVDPMLIYAIIETESGFNAQAVSSAGAIGLMQMTEDTFDWVKTKIASDEALAFESLYTPDISIRFGVYFIAYCLERYSGDVSTAAAAYHSGVGTVDGLLTNSDYTQNGLWLTVFPYSQMQHYVNKINNSYTKYIQLYTE